MFVLLLLIPKSFLLSLEKLSFFSFSALIFVVSLLVHFRSGLVYYWDEWTLILRYFDHGIGSVFAWHNGHFKPLFFSLFLGQASLFGSSYFLLILVSHIIHLTNTLLIFAILSELFRHRPKGMLTARLLAVLYAISSLHSGSLQWAMLQSVMSSQACTLLAVYFGILFVRKRRRVTAFSLSVLSIGFAPFFFGTGFIALPIMSSVLLILFIEKDAKNAPSPKHLGLLILSSAIALVPAIICYRMFGENNLNPSELFSGIQYKLLYTIVGAGLGTLLRGLGLFPSLQMQAPADFVQAISTTFSISGELFFTAIAGLVSLFLLVIALRSNERKHYLYIWCLGHLLLGLSYILPSLGRAAHGAQQALALRYTVVSLLGFSVLLFPYTNALVCSFTEKNNNLFRLLNVFSHLYMTQSYNYYTYRANLNRPYLAQNIEWADTLKQKANSGSDIFKDFEDPEERFTPWRPGTLNAYTPGVEKFLVDAYLWMKES